MMSILKWIPKLEDNQFDQYYPQGRRECKIPYEEKNKEIEVLENFFLKQGRRKQKGHRLLEGDGTLLVVGLAKPKENWLEERENSLQGVVTWTPKRILLNPENTPEL